MHKITEWMDTSKKKKKMTTKQVSYHTEREGNWSAEVFPILTIWIVSYFLKSA